MHMGCWSEVGFVLYLLPYLLDGLLLESISDLSCSAGDVSLCVHLIILRLLGDNNYNNDGSNNSNNVTTMIIIIVMMSE